jgi:poly(3-hydroxybutyrate) depolymerase
MGDTTCETWSGCTDDAEVVLCTVTGGGHCWPGNTDCTLQYSTDEIHASEAALEFFAAHPMP